VGLAVFSLPLSAQPREGPTEERTLPRLVRFAGVLADAPGARPNTVAGVTFRLYKEEQGGVPLWQEVQNIQLDGSCNYSVLLGAASREGLPAELFASNEARWLGVEAAGQPEQQPRVLLLSVPYALKAADAETLGGKPASAFMLAAPAGAEPRAAHSDKHDDMKAADSSASPNVTPNLTGTGTTNFIPIWTSSTNLGNSSFFQTSGKVGLGTTAPVGLLNVAGDGAVSVNYSGLSQVFVSGKTNTNQRLALAYDTVNNLGLVQAFINGGAVQPLILNSAGGNVGIGTGSTAPANTLTVSSHNQLGLSLQAPVSGVGAGLDMQTTGSGGVKWELLATGNGSAQGTGKLNIRNTNTGKDIFTITGAGNVGIGTTSPTAGLYIIANSNLAAFLNNNDPAGTLFVQNDSTAAGSLLFQALASPGGGGCRIDINGNLTCTGSKSAVVPVDNARMVALYAVEAPDNWFEDYGGGKLENGTARITLEPTFAQTVNTNMTYRVFLTPKGDCQGLYVSNESRQGFEVHELRGGQSNVEFDYRIIARRKGYENIRLADQTESMAASRKLMRPPSAGVTNR